MKYYCEGCKTEIRRDSMNFWRCPICEYPNFNKIPDYETPQQYEKRTGKPVSDDTAIWVLFTDGKWKLQYYSQFKNIGGAIVIADPPVPPPDGWKPYAGDCKLL